MASPHGVEIRGPARERYPGILSDEALALVADLQRELGPTREALLRRRAERQAELDAGALPDFPAGTASVREGDWRVAPVPDELAAGHPDGDIPLPPFWGGYRLVPEVVELWQQRANRLHDRLRYTRTADGGWRIERLAP